MSKLNTKCEGCYIQHKGCVIKTIIKLVDMCPCTNCLIKAMCTYQCDDRVDLYVEHYKHFD